MKTQETMIEVEERETRGKNAARRTRTTGRIPAVVYGGGREAVGISVDPREVEAVIDSPRGLNSLIQLRLAGKDLKRLVMIRETQRHPVTERLLHTDFRRVELDKAVDVLVPIELEGTPEGVKNEGGIVEFVTREIEVRVLPDSIPDNLVAEISALHIGQHLEAGDLPLPEGVELLTPPTETVVTVVGKAAEEEPEVAEEDLEAVEGEAPAEGEGEADAEAPSE